MSKKNKLVKIDGGAVGILDYPRALLKGPVAGPAITSMLEDFEDALLTCFSEDELEDAHLHHEDNNLYEQRFRKDVSKLINEINKCGNPFLGDGEELENIYSKLIMSNASSVSVRKAFDIGTGAYETYCKERLCSDKSSIYATITKKKLPLFRQKNTLSTPKSKLKLLSLKSDCQLYASLYIASQARQADLSEFFSHENHVYPVSLSEYGKLWKTDKSDFLNCLT